ncbi:hypothetical protein PRIPAC_71639 [Pristionchus pacificus]|uniref:Uncharacterized protein n=1 Tax=Pristionchus pacificus TaxID=54126 RepID=A0A2A6CRM1_PRIPA|nr:hypothetical protein PRIPAC_71639 [Pristionchus pacificus]|eukprot:PDM80862.1 hypothetical protein PRIPAC_35865 [Pristionchus pacificus]
MAVPFLALLLLLSVVPTTVETRELYDHRMPRLGSFTGRQVMDNRKGGRPLFFLFRPNTNIDIPDGIESN